MSVTLYIYFSVMVIAYVGIMFTITPRHDPRATFDFGYVHPIVARHKHNYAARAAEESSFAQDAYDGLDCGPTLRRRNK